MYEFSGEFALGSVYGVRAWRYTADGTLTGVTFRVPWDVDDNTAVCNRLYHADTCNASSWYGGWMTVGGAMYAHQQGPNCGCPAGCGDLIDPECQCGWWAYNGTGSFNYGGQIVGVIEAFGKVTEGTKGFRAEKARIVALCFPTPPQLAPFPEPTYTRRQRLALAWWRSSIRFDPFGWRERGRNLSNAESKARSQWDLRQRFNAGALGVANIPAEAEAAIRGRYPSVPVYTSMDAMLSAHPLTEAPNVDAG